jgi:hypothetical protein
VERDHGPLAEGAASCHTTHWAIALRAVQSQALGEQSALAEYWLYEEAANRLQVSTRVVKTLIHRMRKRYLALLRDEVGRTVSGPADIDEIHPLCKALIASEARLGL